MKTTSKDDDLIGTHPHRKTASQERKLTIRHRKTSYQSMDLILRQPEGNITWQSDNLESMGHQIVISTNHNFQLEAQFPDGSTISSLRHF